MLFVQHRCWSFLRMIVLETKLKFSERKVQTTRSLNSKPNYFKSWKKEVQNQWTTDLNKGGYQMSQIWYPSLFKSIVHWFCTSFFLDSIWFLVYSSGGLYLPFRKLLVLFLILSFLETINIYVEHLTNELFTARVCLIIPICFMCLYNTPSLLICQ